MHATEKTKKGNGKRSRGKAMKSGGVATDRHAMPGTPPPHARLVLVLAKVVMPEPVQVGVHSIPFSLVPLHQ